MTKSQIVLQSVQPLRPFRKVAVLGAGTMGGQIAAHFANAGLTVELLDIPAAEGNKNAVVEKAFKRILKLRPSPLFSVTTAQRIRLGNFEEHLDRLADVEWVVEAVIERQDIKASLFEKLESVISPGTIVSSNTSGIPISSLTEGRSDSFCEHFLGTHFFNPPRYLKLFEVVPGEKTAPSVVERISEFARLHLGKGVVVAKDSPYFIGNRIGIFAMLLAMKERSEHGFTMQEVDALTGELVGHPKSASFRTADVVGLDVMRAVIENLGSTVQNDESRDIFQVDDELSSLVDSGQLGAKTRSGYYKKEDGEIKSWNPAQQSYESAGDMDLASVAEISRERVLAKRLKRLLTDSTRAGESFRRTTIPLLAYAAMRIPDITDSPASVDNAIKWGFGWEKGPFELWDALGFEEVRSRMSDMDVPVPEWIQNQSSDFSFYISEEGTESVYFPSESSYQKLDLPIDETIYSAPSEVLKETGSTLLRRLTDDVAILEFRSKANTLGSEVIGDLIDAVRSVEDATDIRGLVIANAGSNFSVGANLAEMGQALMGGDFAAISSAIRQFQKAMQVVRNSSKPVVVACHARVLGGATEMMMSCRTPVASGESYLGLVELGVGLIPAGTGCLRLMEKAFRSAPSGHPSEILQRLQLYFKQVAMAEVSSSARHAIEMGYLGASSPVVMREERRFMVAAEEVMRLSEQGYLPETDLETIKVLGAPGRAALESMAYQFHQGQFISEYDLKLAKRLAYVMTGGDLSGDALVSRAYLMDLEREVFLSLLGEENTQARIRHLLETGKPLRN